MAVGRAARRRVPVFRDEILRCGRGEVKKNFFSRFFSSEPQFRFSEGRRSTSSTRRFRYAQTGSPPLRRVFFSPGSEEENAKTTQRVSERAPSR